MLRSMLVAATLAAFSSLACAITSPADVVSGFYTQRIKSGSVGSPSGMELGTFSSYLAPEVVCLLGASLRYNDKFVKALPGEVSPFAQGDLYSSGDASPTSFTVEPQGVSGGSATVKVKFYRDADGVAQNWEDVVHLALIKGRRWLISDVEYRADQPGFKRGRMVQSLRETLNNPSKAAGWDVRELNACQVTPVAGERVAAVERADNQHTGKAAPGKTEKSCKKGKHCKVEKAGKSAKGAKGTKHTKASAVSSKTGKSAKASSAKAASSKSASKSKGTSSKASSAKSSSSSQKKDKKVVKHHN